MGNVIKFSINKIKRTDDLNKKKNYFADKMVVYECFQNLKKFFHRPVH